ncbi:3-phosphoshikimate 1-carboxyvinyltransferase [Candidatus Kinetoplastibacterium desouzaii TCC079E]|uniref:3-phosphoshikimate 1-carboxyvinyltransferase n=1 Tax=Candidatus Kinetoplastidibacterium desouzai TCC079E TaxID=1208919 RepID=M1LMM2_9PROT|nr:3-phosphoshikimate 1-carboxyvinyltransferase [Candidatus Kinetoplastibacterium desouzaii]AGF46977.1 3-phosphoshikimate 1-carboxyvinyltransferase [Candidatus Kinetoplastibacterium desouzaii TCC079E]
MNEKIAYLDLPKYCKAHGSITLPGSKSISNRVLLLAALSPGVTKINGLLNSDDTSVMIDSLNKLGIQINNTSDNVVEIISEGNLNNRNLNLFLGNAGTAFRPLLAALSFMDGTYNLSGIQRMHERPIGDLVDALRQLGCNINYLGDIGYPPVSIGAFQTNNINLVSIKGSVSSQFLTSLLMAAPVFTRKINQSLTIEVEGNLISKPYIDITLNLMKKFGVSVKKLSDNKFFIDSKDFYKSPKEIFIEGDASSASYFLGLGAIAGGPLTVNGVGLDSIQGDVNFTKILQLMGAKINIFSNKIESSGICVQNGEKLKAFDIDFNTIPDAAMTAAVLALYADNKCYLRNIASWRVKETDRILAMKTELSKFGVQVESGDDWLSIDPIEYNLWPRQVSIDTWNDHRMAMCFSLSSFGKTDVRIMDPSCINKTFPDYFDVFNKIAYIK